jgi:organic hydroperoxide reductase OsmC/OhrA
MSIPAYVYETQVKWAGQRRGTLSATGLPDLEISTPPEFKGEAGFWTPEHLFVAAAEVCLMATFVGIAENSKLKVAGYQSSARGRLDKIEGSGLQFTEIAISVVVTLDSFADRALAERVLAKAEKGCLIANSMVARIRVDPTFIQKTALAA